MNISQAHLYVAGSWQVALALPPTRSENRSKPSADTWRLMEDVTGGPDYKQTLKYRKYEEGCSVVSGEFSATAIVHPMLLPQIKLRSKVPCPTDQTGP